MSGVTDPFKSQVRLESEERDCIDLDMRILHGKTT
jgi:hypothetical protein